MKVKKVLSGTLSELPAAAKYGTIFFEKDSNKVHQFINGAWVSLNVGSGYFGNFKLEGNEIANIQNGTKITTRMDGNNGSGFEFAGGFWGGGAGYQALWLGGNLTMQALISNNFPNAKFVISVWPHRPIWLSGSALEVSTNMVQEFADGAAAKAAGLPAGRILGTGETLKIVL